MSEEELRKKFNAEFQAKVAAHMKVMRAARAAEFAARKEESRKLSLALATLQNLVGSPKPPQMQLSQALYLLKRDMQRLAQAQKRTQERLKRLRNVRRHLDGNGPAASPS